MSGHVRGLSGDALHGPPGAALAAAPECAGLPIIVVVRGERGDSF
ncbi:hypothetical protein [Nannocystis pusilla]